jgi:hypothetical protein
LRSLSFVLFILIFIMSGCSGSNADNNRSKSINYDFKEPFRFPFEVNDVRTEVEVYPDSLHQFIFHYKNKETTQEVKYILSIVIDEHETVSEQNKQVVNLENGKLAFYEEDETTQSIWWEGEDGFLARFVYYINGNSTPLNDIKLEISELIELANQVQ